jgi:hypothetical protein
MHQAVVAQTPDGQFFGPKQKRPTKKPAGVIWPPLVYRTPPIVWSRPPANGAMVTNRTKTEVTFARVAIFGAGPHFRVREWCMYKTDKTDRKKTALPPIPGYRAQDAPSPPLFSFPFFSKKLLFIKSFCPICTFCTCPHCGTRNFVAEAHRQPHGFIFLYVFVR